MKISLKQTYANIVIGLLIFQSVLEHYISLFGYLDEVIAICLFVAGLFSTKRKIFTKRRYRKIVIGLLIYDLMGWGSALIFRYTSIQVSLLAWFLSNKFFFAMIGCCCLYMASGTKMLLRIQKTARPLLMMMLFWHFLAEISPSIVDIYTLDLSAKSVFLVCLILMSWNGRNDFAYIAIAFYLLIYTGKGKAFAAIFLVIALLVWVFSIKKKINHKHHKYINIRLT